MTRGRLTIGPQGSAVNGPPWILGHRGAPREAPENTLVALRRALDHGLDGIEYDLRGVATGEAILFHDETLERTSSASGWVADRTLPEIAGIDAGAWFHKSFAGEPIPLLEEALSLPVAAGVEPPMHMIELKEPALVGEVVHALENLERPLPIRLASFHRSVVIEARDRGLATMLLGVEATESDRRFVRDERITAHGLAAGGWRTPAGSAEWSCERWEWAVDEPEHLIAACRRPLTGFNTNVPQRALAVRALCVLATGDDPEYPIRAPRLLVPEGVGSRGAWSGDWSIAIELVNPFPFPVEVAVALALRGGAFEADGLPRELHLGPGQREQIPLALRGGSWSPGHDPHVVARYVWQRGPGIDAGELLFDRALERVRHLRFEGKPVRLEMLAERPGVRGGSMVVRLFKRDLIAEIEDDAGLQDARAWIRVGPESRRGSRGVRVPLDETFRTSDGSQAFCIGFQGRAREGAPLEWRRWAGGLPAEPHGAAPARLTLELEGNGENPEG